MRTFIAYTLLVCFIAALIGFAVGEPRTSGWGKTLTVGVAPQECTNLSIVVLSIYNSDSAAPIKVLVNSTTNELTNAVAQGVAVVIPPQTTFTFNTDGVGFINRFAYNVAGTGVVAYASGF
jgi:hypothetical protein